jgi:predicted AlkP superfamily pyrophosphatase or phosphodiesterase
VTHRIKINWLLIALLVISPHSACHQQAGKSSKPIQNLQPTVILISVDGFRWDYLEKVAAPHLRQLAASGVRAQALIPAFPTKTFPNHYSIVTGLYPEHHGIVANTMYDPEFDAKFSMSNRPAVQDGRWWGGEPLWVTAEKQNQISGILFWPGSEAEILGKRPTYWKIYDDDFPNTARVDTVLAWLDLPATRRPTFLTLYFSDVDHAGHRNSPDSPQVKTAVLEIDAIIGRLAQGLQTRDIFDRVNMIIVSDHGMTEVTSDRVIYLDDYIDLEKVEVIDWNPVVALRPGAMNENEIYEALTNAHPHLRVYRKADIPARLHYQHHRRIMPIIGIADDGWKISRHGARNTREGFYTSGEHGYDNQLPAMRAIFIAHGPAFKSGFVAAPFQNIHLYHLICAILKLQPAPNDGDLDSVRVMLK